MHLERLADVPADPTTDQKRWCLNRAAGYENRLGLDLGLLLSSARSNVRDLYSPPTAVASQAVRPQRIGPLIHMDGSGCGYGSQDGITVQTPGSEHFEAKLFPVRGPVCGIRLIQ